MKTIYLIFMTLSVFILATILFIKQNTSLVFGNPEDFNTVSISVEKSINTEDLQKLTQTVQMIDSEHIIKTHVITAADQLRDVQSALPTYSQGFFEDQEIAQILNPIIELQLTPDAQAQKIVEKIKLLKNVNDVTYANDWTNKIKGLFEALNIILNSVFILFFIILSFLVAILIRNYLIAAKEDIALQTLLGATPRQSFQSQYKSIMVRTFLAYTLGIGIAVFFIFMIKQKLSVNLHLAFVGDRLAFINLNSIAIIFTGLFLNVVVSYALSYQYVIREYYTHD